MNVRQVQIGEVYILLKNKACILIPGYFLNSNYLFWISKYYEYTFVFDIYRRDSLFSLDELIECISFKTMDYDIDIFAHSYGAIFASEIKKRIGFKVRRVHLFAGYAQIDNCYSSVNKRVSSLCKLTEDGVLLLENPFEYINLFNNFPKNSIADIENLQLKIECGLSSSIENSYYFIPCDDEFVSLDVMEMQSSIFSSEKKYIIGADHFTIVSELVIKDVLHDIGSI